MRRHRRAAARIAAGAVLLALLLWWVDPHELWRLLRTADPAWLALGLVLAAAANAASALRWWALARWLGACVSIGWALAAYFRGVAVNALLPGAVVGGDLYRAHALAGRGLPWFEASLSVLGDRLSGLWLLVVIGALAAAGLLQGAAGVPLGRLHALAFGGFGPWALAGMAALALLLPLALLLAWQRGIARPRAGPAPGERPWHRRLLLLAHRPRALAQYGWQLLGSTAVQLLSIGTLACGGMALGIDLPAWAWAAAAVPIFLLATLPLSVGGWGTREAAAVIALAVFGVAAPQAVAVSMLYGLAALVQALGGLVLLVGHRRRAARSAGP
ncbi:MAG TPA: lysylphosphatidylglycerol synthase transmembrane domain-containing protein [Rubrivivax sp.]|nr:lysylphosphatidylglycerol synthase transmembrane domain-containing protein [Rubrivivax sp.]